jgi:hypothetical protein
VTEQQYRLGNGNIDRLDNALMLIVAVLALMLAAAALWIALR